MNISTLTITEARRALDAREFSALELANAYLDAIGKKDAEIHAYLEVWADSAREEARRADELIAHGDAKSLTGIPLAMKDNILIEGRTASSASKMLEKYRASYDATVTRKLKAQGVVFLGRTNMDEFAMGSSTENSAYGPTRNPLDTARVPGGSSGGSAAAVAGGMALGAYGSDTGGSIRQPASLCGLVGLKPTYGAVSRFGLMAMGSSLDQIGPFGKTVEDAKMLFDAIRGYDENDSTSLPESGREATGRRRLPGVPGGVASRSSARTIGVPRAFLKEGVAPETMTAFERTLDGLRARGYEVRDIELPNVPYSLAVYYIVMPAEASTNLARFDGIRYGLSIQEGDIKDVYRKSRAQGLGPETRRRIILGTFVLSSGYADAYYRKARAVRELITQDFLRAFQEVDAIATPTTLGPAFRFGAKSDPLSMYLEDIFTVPVNLAGVPAISVPMGFSETEGKKLPLGFQLIAPHRGEETLFTIGQDVENAAMIR